jgi:hypothetical protein
MKEMGALTLLTAATGADRSRVSRVGFEGFVLMIDLVQIPGSAHAK